MSLSVWPAAVPFEPDRDPLPPSIESLFAAPAEVVPALLVVAGDEARRSGWAARVASALAEEWGRRGAGVILADLDLEAPALHTELGEENLEGVSDMLSFGATVGRVAVPVPGRGFRFVPAGPRGADPDLLADRGWERVLREIGYRRERLLGLIPADAPGLEYLAGLVGRAIVLATPADGAAIAAALPPACDVTMVLQPGEPEPAAADASGAGTAPLTEAPAAEAPAAGPPPVDAPPAEAPPVEPPPAERAARPKRRIWPLFWAALAVALVVAAWFAYIGYFAAVRAPAPVEQVGAPAGGLAGPAVMGGVDAEGTVGAAGDGAAAADGPAEAVPLPFSVAIEAHQELGIAQARVADLRAREPALEFYIAPVLVDGTVYYRVMGGPAADRAGAASIMDHLVARGHKSAVEPWAIRPTSLAFLLEEVEQRAEAVERVQAYARQGIPAYVVAMPGAGAAPRHRVYAGAYEGRAEADVLAGLLRDAGIEARLVERAGRPAS
jgi:hypothetical protein